MLVFTEKLEKRRTIVNQDEIIQDGLLEPETHQGHEEATVLYEPVDKQPETSVCVIETKGQGHNENRGINEDQEGYLLPINIQRVTYISVIGTEGQGHYENREDNEDQEGYVPMNREVITLTQGGATYDNIQDYENSPFNKNEKKNVYEGLQITRNEHPYADI